MAKRFEDLNIGWVVAVVGAVMVFVRIVEDFLIPLAGELIAKYGIAGVIIVIGIIWWLAQESKKSKR